MKHIVFSGMLLLVAAVTGEAMAACAGTQISNVSALLSDKMVCKSQSGSWIWQEHHGSGGDLVDYKMGPGDANDPTSSVGSWSTPTASTVRYDYTTGETYTYDVWETSTGVYSFCNGSTEIVAGATLIATPSPISCGTP